MHRGAKSSTSVSLIRILHKSGVRYLQRDCRSMSNPSLHHLKSGFVRQPAPFWSINDLWCRSQLCPRAVPSGAIGTNLNSYCTNSTKSNSFLTSGALSMSCRSRIPNDAFPAILKVSIMSWSCRGLCLHDNSSRSNYTSLYRFVGSVVWCYLVRRCSDILVFGSHVCLQWVVYGALKLILGSAVDLYVLRGFMIYL